MDGTARAHGDVLVYDDNGTEPAMDATEVLSARGARVELVTPERHLAPGVGSMNSPAYLAAFTEHDVTITLAYRLDSVTRAPTGRLVARLVSDYADHPVERLVDQVVVEHGTVPNDDLYFALLPDSSNLGEVDHDALLEGRPQTVARNAGGRYQLFRIGDAVSSRNVHAAIYDALRLCLAT
jgi:NADPH-dependent 2,4-dienoyl-CoA reductase/sulfur reductase-like enzyme